MLSLWFCNTGVLQHLSVIYVIIKELGPIDSCTRNPHPDHNDIPDLLGKWETKPESEHSWYATRDEIEENDLNLTAGRYKPYVHEEVRYPEPKTIIAEVLEIEDKINKGLKILTEKI